MARPRLRAVVRLRAYWLTLVMLPSTHSTARVVTIEMQADDDRHGGGHHAAERQHQQDHGQRDGDRLGHGQALDDRLADAFVDHARSPARHRGRARAGSPSWATMALARELTVLSLPGNVARTRPAWPVWLSSALLPVDQ